MEPWVRTNEDDVLSFGCFSAEFAFLGGRYKVSASEEDQHNIPVSYTHLTLPTIA